MQSITAIIDNYEKTGREIILPYNSFVVCLRLDNYIEFKEELLKPYDKNFFFSICNTTNDLINKFNCSTIYTFENEINLVFSKICTAEEYQIGKSINPGEISYNHIYNGLPYKISNAISSYCSVKFNLYLDEILSKEDVSLKYSSKFREIVKNHQQIFSCSIYELNSEQIYNYIILRMNTCEENLIISLGKYYLGERSVYNKNVHEILDMLKFVDIKLDERPYYMFYGIFGKKLDTDTIIYKSFDLSEIPGPVQLILEDYWSNTDDSIDIYNL